MQPTDEPAISSATESEELRADGAFTSSADYFAFIKEIENSADLIETPVEKPYSNVGLIERWFKSKSSGRMWRLVEPDFPFKGLWQEIV